MPRQTQLNCIVRKAERQRKALKRTQLQFAAATRPEDGPKLTDPKWRWKEKLAAKYAEKITAYPGVLGYGLGFREQANEPTDEPCLTVYVRKKHTPEQLEKTKRKALPRFIGSGKRRLRVDVVELGKLERFTTLGESISSPGPRGIGTLGVLAVDQTTGRTVAITAQHVTGLKQIPQGRVQTMRVFVPRVGRQGSAWYGEVVAGSMLGIDACKIELRHPNGTDPRIPFIGEVKGTRPMRLPGDRNLPVRMYGDTSGLQAGLVHNPLVALPKFGLDAAIVVRMLGQRGDSGAALVDQHNLVLGTLVGQAQSGFLIFCAMSETLARLGCDIPTVRN